MIKKTLHHKQAHNNPAKDFFLHLLEFFSLAFVVFGEGAILFQFINKFVSDQIERTISPFDQGGVKFGIAALIIAGPMFFFVSKIIFQRIREKKTPLDSSVRKWLTYIVLFFAAATVIGDLIALVVNFLNGDAAWGFLLKVLTILLIAGAVFAYYFWDMLKKQDDREKKRINFFAIRVSIAVMAITFIASFFVIDSPVVSKQKRIDGQVVLNLQNIDESVRGYFDQTEKLPKSLDDLKKTGIEPALQKGLGNITYEMKVGDVYTLCADFVRSDKSDTEANVVIVSDEWKHNVGRVCFDRIALKSSK
jgi:hypothetical protein